MQRYWCRTAHATHSLVAVGYMGIFDFLRPHKRIQPTKSQRDQRTLVIPVDDSQHSLQAVEWAVHNVYKPDTDELHLLGVIPRVAGPYPAEVSCRTAAVPAAIR